MNATPFDQLVARAGIEPVYDDAWGRRRSVLVRTQRALLGAMGLKCKTAAEVRASLARLDAVIRQKPPPRGQSARAWRPDALAGDGRRWGLAVQLYALRSARNWGIGDFTDLENLVRGAAALGAAAIGINPLHALFPGHPEEASPYSPSSRLFFNPLYLDVAAIEDFASCKALHQRVGSPAFRARIEAARASDVVDYRAVASLKWPILEETYRAFRKSCLATAGGARRGAFRSFQARHGDALRRFATFHALARRRRQHDWRTWPARLREPGSPAVADFEREHIDAIEFHEYLQWQVSLQLARVKKAVDDAGMSIGLYTDLAVGTRPGGAEAWSTQRDWIEGVAIGAPPDALNLEGQNWGLPPPDPVTLRASACAHYGELLRANMRSTGALRIDHILGLLRLWWIPEGQPAVKGAYVRYPHRELFDALVEASRRHRCFVIGEDLGTVPPGLRHALRRAGVLSYRLLYFEQRDRGFPPPGRFPAEALVAIGTHDLPTFPMWWQSEDIALRQELGLWPNQRMRRAEVENRRQARSALLRRLSREHLLAGNTAPEEAPVEAAYAYLARTPCKLLMVQLADVLDQHVQSNVPGTVNEYPNWRHKLPVLIETALASPRLLAVADACSQTGRADAATR